MSAHHLLAFLTSLGALAASLPAQNVRASQQIDLGQTGPAAGPSISSYLNLSAVAWEDSSTNAIYVSTSDGRGLQWSAPVRVDSSAIGANKFTKTDSCVVLDGSIYVSWRDERNGLDDDLYFTVSHDGGQTWAPDQMIDKGHPVGSSPVRDWRMMPALGQHVYFLVSTDNPVTGNEDLFLTASHDGGVTFAPTAFVPRGFGTGAVDVDQIALIAEGYAVHVAWADSRSAAGYDDIWYQRSLDGGLTWFGNDVQIDSSPVGTGDADYDIGIRSEGDNVVIAWCEDQAFVSRHMLFYRVSTDLGASWGGSDHLLAGDPMGTYDVDNMQVGLLHGTIRVAWEDNRTGQDEVYLAMTQDMGSTWNEMLVSGGSGGSHPVIYGGIGDPVPDVDVILGCNCEGDKCKCECDCRTSAESSYLDNSYPNEAKGWFTRDGVTATGSDLPLSNNSGFDVDYLEMAFNLTYSNTIVAYLADDLGANHLYVGGYRAPTLTPSGPLISGTAIHFEASHFPTLDAGKTFAVLVSGAPGDLLLPTDPRNIGLAQDSIFSQAMNMIPGSLSATIQADGTATTPSFTLPALTSGMSLYLVGVAATSAGDLGQITDLQVHTVQ